jgi:DNA-binding MarR family transcriptional regulator
MSNRRPNRAPLPYETTIKVRDNCLCLHLQRAARAVARHFDELMRPTGLTSGQFSLLMSLNRPDPPTMRAVAELLAMDRTTLTANLKPLERRGFVRVRIDRNDRRSRRLVLTTKGRLALAAALPAWEEGHSLIEPALAGRNANRLRADLRALA